MRLRLRKRDKGYDLAFADLHTYPMQVATLSGMDAADLLFQMKDELRRTRLGRSCLDAVADERRRKAETEREGTAA